MATRVRYRNQNDTTITNGSKTFTIANTPTAGNTLLFAVIMDKNKTMSVKPAGFTHLIEQNNPQVSLYLGVKIADGSETSIAFNVGSNSNAACRMLYWEYSGNISIGGHNFNYVDGSFYIISTNTTGALSTSNGEAIVIAAVDSVSFWKSSYDANNGAGAVSNALWFDNGYTIGTDTTANHEEYSVIDPASTSGIPGFAIGYKVGGLTLGGESSTFNVHTYTSPGYDQMAAMVIVISDNSTPPAITTPTPSGTLGTRTSATLGVTTDSASGTLYAVASTVAGDIDNIPTNSGSTVVDGKVYGGANAPLSTNQAVSTTTPTMPLSGLTAGVTYYAAMVQVTASGVSNVVKTSFTTATSVRAFSLTGLGVDVSGSFTLLASKAVKVWTALNTAGAAVDGGSTGLDGTIVNGTLDMTSLTIAAGTIQVRLVDPTDALNAHMYSATATEVN